MTPPSDELDFGFAAEKTRKEASDDEKRENSKRIKTNKVKGSDLQDFVDHSKAQGAELPFLNKILENPDFDEDATVTLLPAAVDGESFYRPERKERQYVPAYRGGDSLNTPQEALDLHLRYWSSLETFPARRMWKHFIRSYYTPEQLAESEDFFINGHLAAEQSVWNIGRTIHVSKMVTRLVSELGSAMPPDMLKAHDLPWQAGVLLFEDDTVLNYFDYDDELYAQKENPFLDIGIRAVAWQVTDVSITTPGDVMKPGVQLSLYVDKAFVEHTAISVGDAPFPNTLPLAIVDVLGWAFDTEWRDRLDGEETTTTSQSPHVGAFRRKFLALMRFMNEEIIRTEHVKPTRPGMKRWVRSDKNVPEDGSITCLHLRKYHATPRTPSDREPAEAIKGEWPYAYAFWRVGHWRYDPKTGAKTTWVRPTIVGSHIPGLELILKEKLVSVSR